jgi:hypothetical protein
LSSENFDMVRNDNSTALGAEVERLGNQAARLGLGVVRTIVFLTRVDDPEIRALFRCWIARDARRVARIGLAYLAKGGRAPTERPTNERSARRRQRMLDEMARVKFLDLILKANFEPRRRGRPRKKVDLEELSGPPKTVRRKRALPS